MLFSIFINFDIEYLFNDYSCARNSFQRNYYSGKFNASQLKQMGIIKNINYYARLLKIFVIMLRCEGDKEKQNKTRGQGKKVNKFE